jgi:CheY-like chemotaxis protein
MDSSCPPSIILVADDDPAVTLALLLTFELRGLVAESTHTPAETVQRVARGGVRLVVHDMNFSKEDTSGADGLALLRELRRTATSLPVILITSWPAAGMSARALQEGAAAVLAKPWDDEQLVSLALQLVAHQSGQ